MSMLTILLFYVMSKTFQLLKFWRNWPHKDKCVTLGAMLNASVLAYRVMQIMFSLYDICFQLVMTFCSVAQQHGKKLLKFVELEKNDCCCC